MLKNAWGDGPLFSVCRGLYLVPGFLGMRLSILVHPDPYSKTGEIVSKGLLNALKRCGARLLPSLGPAGDFCNNLRKRKV